MSKVKLNKMRRTNRILLIISAIIGMYTLVNIVSIQYDVAQKNKTIESLSKDKIQQEIINDELFAVIEEGITDEAIIEVAQDKLGLALPGERVVEDIGSK
ncbi:MAG: septum formation initiator family protein [Clostridia bacterium]